MNTVESYNITNPVGKEDECAKFVIDTITSQFVLSDTTDADQEYTLSFWIKSDIEGYIRICDTNFNVSDTWTKHIHTFVAPDDDVKFRFLKNGTYYVYNIKLEKGNVATDWTEAPEDMMEAATNFMSYDSENGLQLGNKIDDEWFGYRTRITASSFDILDDENAKIASYGADGIELGKKDSFHTRITTSSFDILDDENAKIASYGTDVIELGKQDSFHTQITTTAFDIINSVGETLASYKAKLVELGKNAKDAVISFCEGKALIRYVTTPENPAIDSGSDYIEMCGENVRIRGDNEASLYSMYYDNAYVGQKSASVINPAQVYLYSQQSTDIDPGTLVGVWSTSSLSMTPLSIDMYTRGELRIMGGELGATFGTTFGNLNLDASFGSVNINGRAYGTNKVLWSGSYYMNASQTITLSEAISSQPNGVILVFSAYNNGASSNSYFNAHFIPKHFVSAHNTCAMTLFACGAIAGWYHMNKYVYFADTTIKGYDGNSTSHSKEGITVHNQWYVLRYVIGV